MKISITRQLWTLSFGFFIFMIVTSVGSFLSSRALLGQLDIAVNTQMVAIRNMTLADMMHDGIRGVVTEAIIAANEKISSELELLITEADEKSNNFSKYLAVLETLKLSPETHSAIIETEILKDTYITQAKSIVETAKQAGYSQALVQLPKFKESFFKLEEKMEYLGDLIEKDAKPDLASGEFYLNLNILIAIASLLIGCTSTVWILTRLIRELKSFILRMREAGTHVSQTSTKMSFTSQESANTAGLSATSLQETTASVEELNSMVKINSDNAQSASALAEQTRGGVTSGMREMQTLVKVIADLSASSKKMEDIINVIDDIAFQTNLLALNAAVEAARAGEQGKGFAVVAEAVRSLAQRSSIAAKDISVMIQANIEKITVGNGITTRSSESLEKMVAEITRVSQINAEIASASNEQSLALSQITSAMNSLDKSTQTSALASEDLSFASKEMQEQAQQMAALVVSFEQIALGDNATEINVNSYSTN